MDYREERLIELLLTIDEEATLVFGPQMVAVYESYARRHGHEPHV